jgi:hypothetical protein
VSRIQFLSAIECNTRRCVVNVAVLVYVCERSCGNQNNRIHCDHQLVSIQYNKMTISLTNPIKDVRAKFMLTRF